MFKLFRKKMKKLPRSIEVALEEYRKLRLEGCLFIPCEKCRHLMELDEHHYTCKRIQLMKVLMPEYIEEVRKIDDETRKQVE